MKETPDIGMRGWAVSIGAIGLLCSLAQPAQAQTNVVRVGSISSFSIPGAVVGPYLYAFNSGSSLVIFDVSNPTNVVDVGYRDTEMCQAMAISGNHAYVVNMNPSISFNPVWLQILSISNATNPVAISRINGNWNDVCVAGDYAYLFSGGGSFIYNVSNAASPSFVHTFPAAATGVVLGKLRLSLQPTAAAAHEWIN